MDTDDLEIFSDTSGSEVYSLPRLELESLFESNDKIGIIYDVECAYDALVLSFLEFKSRLYKTTIESVQWGWKPYAEAHAARMSLNISLASVLNSAKYLTDQLQGSPNHPSFLKSLDSGKRKPSAKICNYISKEYDTSDNYFVMGLARNFLQHSGIVVDNIKAVRETRHDGFCEYKLEINLNLSEIRSDLSVSAPLKGEGGITAENRFLSFDKKTSRLNRIGEPIGLLPTLESYMLSLSKIMKVFRDETQEIHKEQTKKHGDSLGSILEWLELSGKGVGKCIVHPILLSGKWNGRSLPYTLEWDLTEKLQMKNDLLPLDVGRMIFAIDDRRRIGFTP